MHIHFQTDAAHAKRLDNAALIVDNIFLRQNMDDIPVHGDSDGFCRVKDAFDIFLADFSAFDCDNAVAVRAFYVAACNARIYGTDGAADHSLSFVNGLPNGLNRLFNIYDNSFAKPR